MESTQECGHLGSGSECQACCIDIAAGVLMEWGGLTPDEARASLIRTAQFKNVTVEAWAHTVVDCAAKGLARSTDTLHSH